MEMLAAAIALRYAFPYMLYAVGVNTAHGGSGGDYENLMDEKSGLAGGGKIWKNDSGVIGVGKLVSEGLP